MKLQHATSGFWYVTYCGERSRKVLEPQLGKRDLYEELSGSPIGKNWLPPKYQIVGKGLWPDWMAYLVPLLSDRALTCLQDLIAPHCELLPWIKEPRHAYTLINITTRIPVQNWSCQKSSKYGDVYAAADVITLHGVAIPDLFCLKGYDGKFFVSDAVASRSVEKQLKGAVFVDPSIPESHLPFIPFNFGKRGTGFILRENDLGADPRHAVH